MTSPGQSHLSGRQALAVEADNLSHLADIRFDISVELGRKELTLGGAARLRPGDAIVLDKVAGGPMAILANGHDFAEGEITMVTATKACRIKRIVTREATDAPAASQSGATL